MQNGDIIIIPFELSHQPGVDLLYQTIREEFPEEVFPDRTLTLTKLSHTAGRHYWVALAKQKVAGTIGVLLLADNCCCLKSMFLAKELRSDKREIAKLLLKTATEYAKSQRCKMICLGTMAQFTAAQRFYEKNGFVRVPKDQLPPDFPANSVDTVFYWKMF